MSNNLNKPRVAYGIKGTTQEALDATDSLLKGKEGSNIEFKRPELRGGGDRYTDWAIYNMTEPCEYDRYLIASSFYVNFQTASAETQAKYLNSVFVCGLEHMGITSSLDVPEEDPYFLILKDPSDIETVNFGDFKFTADKLKRQPKREYSHYPDGPTYTTRRNNLLAVATIYHQRSDIYDDIPF